MIGAPTLTAGTAELGPGSGNHPRAGHFLPAEVSMLLELSWQDAAIRLALAIVAGLVVGFNREERSQAAGLRTTVLVCLAACLAMVLANLLLDTSGKDQTKFAQIDVLRLPLGILSGIGF